MGVACVPRAVEPGDSRRPRLLVSLRLPRLCPRHTRLTTLDSGAEQHGRDASPRGRRSPWCKTGFVCPDRLSPSLGTAVLPKRALRAGEIRGKLGRNLRVGITRQGCGSWVLELAAGDSKLRFAGDHTQARASFADYTHIVS